MKFKRISILIYIIGILFLVGCVKTKTVDTQIVPENSGQVIGEGEYEVNSIVHLKAIPNKEYEFIGWFDSADKKVSSEKELEINADSNKEYLVKFESKEFEVKIKSTLENAKLYGEGVYTKGDQTYIKADDLNGYEFSHWEDQNGNIFSTKNNLMITVEKNNYLEAIYTKKNQNFFYGIARDEILNTVIPIYESFFNSIDQHYFTYKDTESKIRISESVLNGLKNGYYFIDLKPDNYNVSSLKNMTHEIKVENNKLVVISSIDLPSIKKINDTEKIKNAYKDNNEKSLNLKKFLENYINYDENTMKAYQFKVHFTKKNDEILMTKIEQPDGLFNNYEKLWEEVFEDQMSSINIHLKNYLPDRIVLNYDNIDYNLEYDSQVFDNRFLYSNINFIIEDDHIINLERLRNKIRETKNENFIVDSQLFDDLEFYKLEDRNKILIKISYAYGMNPYTIFSTYDYENNIFEHTSKISGWITEDSMQFSNDNNYLSVILSDSSGRKTLEIFNIISKERIKLLDLLEENKINVNGTPIFKNVTWDTVSKIIEFEYYNYFPETASMKESLLNKGKFRYNLNDKELVSVINNLEDYKSIAIESREELINIIDSSIEYVDVKTADAMVYDLINKNNNQTHIKKYDEYFEYYFGKMSHMELTNIIYSAIREAEKEYPNTFDNKNKLYDNDKRIMLDYIENEKIKEKITRYFNHYYGFRGSDPVFMRKIDFIEVKNKFGKYLSNEFNKYLDLKIEERLNELRFEVYILLSPDELATRMINFESFLKTADNESIKKDIKKSYMQCLDVLLNPEHIISYLNEYHQATFEYRMALDRLMKDSSVEVTQMAAKRMFEFVYSKKDFVLRSYSNNSEMKKNYEDILSDVEPLLNERYFMSND